MVGAAHRAQTRKGESMKQEDKDKLLDHTVTVRYNGLYYDSKVTGRLNRFATVAPYHQEAPSFQFSWEAVARAVQYGHYLKA